jgi:2-keto-4-pentenoate hydratase/2-oxohepta-3-ene-1,7-dioic acid hydratase in catechol pathway
VTASPTKEERELLQRPGKIICVGRNYAAHAKELGNAVPDKPLLFFKPPSAIIAHGETIVLPTLSEQVEHEAEVGVLIGQKLRNVDQDGARKGIAGITCVNDVTARDLQKTDGHWVRAKGFDTFCPWGPRVVPLPGEAELVKTEVICRVNGTERQHGTVGDMVFSIPFLVSYVSQVMTLEPGDLIATGTPEGVGALHDGDVVEVEVTGVGVLRNTVRKGETRKGKGEK